MYFFFEIHAFESTPFIKSGKFQEVCFIFMPFIHIYPEQLYIMKIFTGHFFLDG